MQLRIHTHRTAWRALGFFITISAWVMVLETGRADFFTNSTGLIFDSGNTRQSLNLRSHETLEVPLQDLVGHISGFGLLLESATEGEEERSSFLTLRADKIFRGKDEFAVSLPDHGKVIKQSGKIQWVRPNLSEEFSGSRDGLRQDFIIEARPIGEGELCIALKLEGAVARLSKQGISLTLLKDSRQLEYGRLIVNDATGRNLESKMSVSEAGTPELRIKDEGAVYPVRIDPTFSDADWFSMRGHNGPSNRVRAIALDDDSNLYIGGAFVGVGKTDANYVAKWNGNVWSSLGIGTNSEVSSLLWNNGNLYVAGDFTTAGGVSAARVARWDGSQWFALGTGFDQSVRRLALHDGSIYAGGNFTTPASYLARWDGAAWVAVGNGPNGRVSALESFAGKLIVGGTFLSAGSSTANYIAGWDGTSWASLGLGVDGTVTTLTSAGTDLYVGGDFSTAGSLPASRIARWDGAAWSSLGTGLKINEQISATILHEGKLYIGGQFTVAGGIPANGIARWSGSGWEVPESLSLAERSNVNSFLSTDAGLITGGAFSTATAGVTQNLALWNGDRWQGYGDPEDQILEPLPVPNAMAYWNGNLYVSGGSVNPGNPPLVKRYPVLQWDGDKWKSLGTGMNNSVLAIAASESGIYAAGEFTSADDVTYSGRIARWDGVKWNAMGAGMNDRITALAVSGSTVYAAGNFTTANQAPANRIAKWDGIQWTALGLGLNGHAWSLAMSGQDVFVGGDFTSAGNTSARRIAKWNGSEWSELGLGVNKTVYCLAVDSNKLYAGGDFTVAGQVSVLNVAQWDGSQWSGLGSGLDGFRTTALAVAGENLYAAGFFTKAGGVPASYIAKWNGTDWSSLGSGLGGFKGATGAWKDFSLAVSNYYLFVGGPFSTAGGKISPNLARASITTPESEVYSTAVSDAGLSGTASLTESMPFGDGVSNLIKFAFNLDLSGPDFHLLSPGTGTSGLPVITCLTTVFPAKLRFEFVRNPANGLDYSPVISDSLDNWVPLSSVPLVENIGGSWERVVYLEDIPTHQQKIMGAVRISIP